MADFDLSPEALRKSADWLRRSCVYWESGDSPCGADESPRCGYCRAAAQLEALADATVETKCPACGVTTIDLMAALKNSLAKQSPPDETRAEFLEKRHLEQRRGT